MGFGVRYIRSESKRGGGGGIVRSLNKIRAKSRTSSLTVIVPNIKSRVKRAPSVMKIISDHFILKEGTRTSIAGFKSSFSRYGVYYTRPRRER